jgi:hypothetical protein
MVVRGVRLVGVCTVERGVAGAARLAASAFFWRRAIRSLRALVQMAGLYIFDYYVPWVILMAILIGAAITGWSVWRRCRN